MSESEQPLHCAIKLRWAVERYCSSDLITAKKEAHKRAQELNAFSRGVYTQERRDARHAFRDVQEQLSNNILQQLINGNFTAWARGGRPDADWTKMPADAWNYLTPDCHESSACTKDGLKYFNIHVYPTVFIDSRWDGGLPLLDACKLLDPRLAEDLVAPWAPDLPDGTLDEDWADGSRDWAADQMWRIIFSYQTDRAISLYIHNPDNDEWSHIHEITFEIKENDSRRVDFIESRIRLDVWEQPVPCLLVRYNEHPNDVLTKNDAYELGVKKLKFSKANVTAAYCERIKDWPPEERSPSRSNDEKWGREKFGVPRDFMRSLRKKHAPDSWCVTGPKKKNK